MSTVHEVVTARHMSLKCLAFSLITNTCETHPKVSIEGSNVEEEVFNVATSAEPLLKDFVSQLVKRLVSSDES